MTESLPPLLAGFDWTALTWALGWALLFSASGLPEQRRRQARAGQALTPWSEVLWSTLAGGTLGGVLFALLGPEIWPTLRGQGKQAGLAVAGAALGPYLRAWIVRGAPQVIKDKFGVDVGGEGDDREAKS